MRLEQEALSDRLALVRADLAQMRNQLTAQPSTSAAASCPIPRAPGG